MLSARAFAKSQKSGFLCTITILRIPNSLSGIS